jgi:hypothetical protein
MAHLLVQLLAVRDPTQHTPTRRGLTRSRRNPLVLNSPFLSSHEPTRSAANSTHLQGQHRLFLDRPPSRQVETTLQMVCQDCRGLQPIRLRAWPEPHFAPSQMRARMVQPEATMTGQARPLHPSEVHRLGRQAGLRRRMGALAWPECQRKALRHRHHRVQRSLLHLLPSNERRSVQLLFRSLPRSTPTSCRGSRGLVHSGPCPTIHV